MRYFFMLVALGYAAAFAAPPSQTTTYVDGNISGLTANTGATLSFDDDKAMYLHAGETTVPVPYAGVSHAELGAIKDNSHAPIYKFWSHLKKSPKTETQLLIVNFKNEQGDDKTMTLELAEQGASSVLADLEARTGKNFSGKKKDPMATAKSVSRQADSWWGDEYWKTDRNADKWSKTSGSNDQQQ